MKASELQALLAEFYRDKLALMLRHVEGARLVAQYDANNTYQYHINRDETHLSWLASALADLGGTPPGDVAAAPREAGEKGDALARRIFEEDARDAQAFVDRWRPRVEQVDNARHRGMLRVILGEELEQKRSFEQALAGRTDLLGRREEEIVGPAKGDVLPTRWVE